MPQQLSINRSNLTKVPTLIKQGSLLSAAQATRKALHSTITTSLMRHEIDEMHRLLRDACDYLNSDEELRTLFPLTMELVKGEEKELLATLDSLIDVLQSDAAQGAIKKAEEISKRKLQRLEKGKQELERQEFELARDTFSELCSTFPGDHNLINDIAQSFMSNSLFEDAANYFEIVLNLAPDNTFALNKLGIVLRRLEKYELSEKQFLRAIQLDETDPNLFFNLGRLYLDWAKWEEGIKSVTIACKLAPDFAEAKKMLTYLNKKQGS